METLDSLGRHLRDLRISVTDRCNFRCTYCMPKELFGADHAFLPRASLLDFDEIARLARLFAELGVSKLRLTGGEPLVRKDIEKLVARLAPIPGIADISLTTNGSLLTPAKARALADAGLKRITVSLDALDDATFQRMNGVGFPVARVLEAIDNAAAAGLAPVKVNMVVKRGDNASDIEAMAGHFRHTGHILRFIEYMDVGNTNGWRLDEVVAGREIVERIGARWPIEPADPHYRGEVAKRWRYVDGGGEIGIITSVTQPFCRNCTRARLSAEGALYTCLFATRGFDLRALVRSGTDDDALRAQLAAVWHGRSDRYSELRSLQTPLQAGHKIEMSYIGG
ncbi:MAG: GTP 3',8-cyclase MoaA [Nevskiaceae bacterium]|nr:MAG: GTP 3',8-cyclase MoaA [Nevskiaceae bacterium]TBR74331.1 MAG: GTP 3',8-cyclase MoaA [Nevskiaceae bacterium]